jgi:hypothetical protein
MASSGCRALARLGLLLGAIAAAGCSQRSIAPDTAAPTTAASPTASPSSSAASVEQGAPAAFTDPGIELAPGEGRDIMLSKCLGCHDLGGIDLFAGFYSREDWHRLIETMIAHGATIDTAEAEVVADYLALHYSPKP